MDDARFARAGCGCASRPRTRRAGGRGPRPQPRPLPVRAALPCAPAARALADTVVVFAGNGPSSMRAPQTCQSGVRQVGGRAAGCGRPRVAHRAGAPGVAAAMSAAPSSAASGSAREARRTFWLAAPCLSGARAASAAELRHDPGEQRREVGAKHRPPSSSPPRAPQCSPASPATTALLRRMPRRVSELSARAEGLECRRTDASVMQRARQPQREIRHCDDRHQHQQHREDETDHPRHGLLHPDAREPRRHHQVDRHRRVTARSPPCR